MYVVDDLDLYKKENPYTSDLINIFLAEGISGIDRVFTEKIPVAKLKSLVYDIIEEITNDQLEKLKSEVIKNSKVIEIKFQSIFN